MAQVYISQYARRAGIADTALTASYIPPVISLPGGQNTQIQFNSGGIALSGSPNFTFNYAADPQVLSMTGSIILSGSTFLFGLSGSTAPQVLVYDDVTGQVYYTASSAFGGVGSSPGNPPNSIQFNNAGNFGGSANLTFDGTNIVQLTGSMLVSGAISASFGPSTVGFYGTSSWAVSASQAISASFASTASFAVTASYASSSPNFANANLVFTSDRKHDTNKYSFFLYSDLVGGNETDPFDGFGVSGSFYYFNSSSNALGTAAGSTNTYTYIEITSQSIDLSFDANPAVQSSYTFTKTSASFSSSLTVTKSVFFPGLTSASQLNVVVIDSASGRLYYLNSSSLGGGTATFSGADTQVVFFSGSDQISGSSTITYDYLNSHFFITGSTTLSGSTFLPGINDTSQQYVLTYNPVGGQVYYTASNALSAVSIPLDIEDEGILVVSSPTFINFTGSGVSASANGTGVDVYIPSSSVFPFTGSAGITGSIVLTGSMLVSGAISASFGPNTVGFYGTASWAQSASFAGTASFITASNVWGPFGSSSVLSASYASGSTSASYAATASFILNPYPINVTGSTLYSVAPVSGVPSSNGTIDSIFFGTGSGLTATDASQSVFLGRNAGRSATNANNSNFIGNTAGQNATNANNSNFLGQNAGLTATNANNSNFLGLSAGQNATNASQSVFIGGSSGLSATNAAQSFFLGGTSGYQATNAAQSSFIGHQAGNIATNASGSNFIGYQAGQYARSASYSVIIGYKAGQNQFDNRYILSNNIIIGTNITLPTASQNSINIGGIIFATGSYSTITGNSFSGSAAGRVGINIYPPQYNLHVSGTVAFPNLTNISQINAVVIDTASGQLYYLPTSSIGGGGGTPAPSDTYIQYNESDAFGAEEFFRYNYTDHSLNLGNNVTASGNYSFAQGFTVLASGNYSFAQGQQNTASGLYSHAEGAFNQATNQGSHAEGETTLASGVRAHSEGSNTTASGNTSHAEGSNTKAIGISAHSEGYFTVAFGDRSHAEGYGSIASGSYSHAEGDSTSYGDYSHAEGINTEAHGYASNTKGSHTVASGSYQLVVGQYNVFNESQSAFIIGDGANSGNRHNLLFASKSWFEVSASNVFLQGLTNTSQTDVLTYNSTTGQVFYTASSAIGGGSGTPTPPAPSDTYIQYNSGSSFAATGSFRFIYTSQSFQQGFDTTASGFYSHAQGLKSVALGEYSHAEGGINEKGTIRFNQAIGTGSHAEGANTIAFGDFSHAEGYGGYAESDGSHVEGYQTYATKPYSHAEGYLTSASGQGSHSEGNLTVASGLGSHAEGYGSIATSTGSHAEGQYTTASNLYSHAEGVETTTIGIGSHAEGYRTYTSNSYSHAEGYYTKAINLGSHAEGQYTTASGNYSHAAGYYTTTLGNYQSAIGQHNISSTSQSAFIIGDGGEGLVLNTGPLYTNIQIGDQLDVYIKTSSISGFIPDDYFIGGTVTFTSASVSETFTLVDVTNNGVDRYYFDLDNPVGYDYAAASTTVYVTSGPNAKHNLLFASRSWFELDAGDSFIKNLPSSSQSYIIGYNTSSGQLSYTTVFPYTGSAKITGSLIVSGGFIAYNPATGYDTIDSNNGYLLDPSGIASIEWNSRTLYDSAGSTSVDWENFRLSDNSGNRSLDWLNRILHDNTATSILDWNTPGQILVTSDIIPDGPYVDNTSSFNLGSPTAAWDKIYVSNNSLHFVSGSVSASIGFNNGVISFNNATVNLPSGSISPTASLAQTASYLNTLTQNVIITGSLYNTGDIESKGSVKSLYSLGDEGGEFFLAQSQTNTTLAGGITIDSYQNRIRFFEQGGSARGAYIDLTACAGGAGTNLLSGGSTSNIAAKYMGFGNNLTGSNLISASYNLLIPANTFTVGDVIKINCLWNKPNSATSTNFSFWITGSTTEFSRSTTGATQLALYNTTANRTVGMSRLLWVSSSTSTQTTLVTNGNLFSDEYGVQNVAGFGGTSSLNIDWTTDKWIIFAATNATAADLTQGYRFTVTKV